MVASSGMMAHPALSQKRARFSGPGGARGLVANSYVFFVAVFASLGGFVYGYNQGMFGQILNMTSFANTVHPESISNTTLRPVRTNNSPRTMQYPEQVAFEPRGLATVLYQVYLNMFENEDVTRMMSDVTVLKLQKYLIPVYQRASFAAFVSFVKARVIVDWQETSLNDRKLHTRTICMAPFTWYLLCGGFLTAILELGAWVGVLINGVMADALGRKQATQVGALTFCVGVIVQACAKNVDYIVGGRFVTGLGVGTLSMVVPLYNAELAPPELRGALVALQQLAICFGIMLSYWIGYGTNFIGGTGASQSNAAWEIPVCIQLIPAIILGIGIQFMPQSPRWLMSKGADEQCLAVLAHLRRKPATDEGVQLEYLEVKAQYLFERETSIAKFPDYRDGTFTSNVKLSYHGYLSLLTNRSLFKRVVIAVMIMVFQQWSGINAILYYAAFIFKDLGLTGNTTSLLASGVGDILLFAATIPAVLYIDKLGRKPVLITGAIGMGVSHFIVAGLIGAYSTAWQQHKVAGWVAVVFVWIYEINFGYSWGPGAWILVSEVFPLGVRAKGISIGGSSNWLNNFAIGQATPDMVASMSYGTFVFFGLMCILGAAFVYLFVPETKNLTLEEMDEVFGDEAGCGVQDRDRLNKIYQELGLTSEDPHMREALEKASVGMREVHVTTT